MGYLPKFPQVNVSHEKINENENMLTIEGESKEYDGMYRYVYYSIIYDTGNMKTKYIRKTDISRLHTNSGTISTHIYCSVKDDIDYLQYDKDTEHLEYRDNFLKDIENLGYIMIDDNGYKFCELMLLTDKRFGISLDKVHEFAKNGKVISYTVEELS